MKPPDERSIRLQLDRITESANFDTSKRSADFLRFVVSETLAGRSAEISQQAIAGSVFGRGDEFDPTTDPIVRMQAGRVRRSLEHYYLTDGAADAISIGLPKGSYVPTFKKREPAVKGVEADRADTESWPTLLISPLHNLTGREEAEFIAQGLASDLAAELSRDKAVQVFLSPDPDAGSKQSHPARFELSGTLGLRREGFKINFHLIDTETRRQTWARTYECPDGPEQGAVLDRIVQITVAMIVEERGILSSQLAGESCQRPSLVGSAYEAILRYHHFEATKSPQAFVDALAALRKSVKAHPDCALCWSYLARLGGAHWSLGIAGETIPIEDSIAAGRLGAELAPMDVRCRALLSYVLLLGDEMDEARREAEVAFGLGGASIFWQDAVGYLLTLAGDWERGPALLREAMQINPFPRRACYGALWLDALRRDDPAAVLAAAREHAPESYFWSPLMEAVALVVGGRVEEAREAGERLLAITPDFAERGHWLITRYVKSEPLVEKIGRALAEAGGGVRQG